MPDSNRRSMTTIQLVYDKRKARHEEVLPHGEAKSVKETLVTMFKSPISVLLITVPLGIASKYVGWGDQCTFWLNFFAMVPLAKLLGDATEELANCLKNDMLAGLLNATFGNAVEMIMTFCLLQKGEYAVVKFALVGSILSNLLLVLGCSFLCGGLVRAKTGEDAAEAYKEIEESKGKEQEFNQLGSVVNTSMLLLACLVMCLVTIFDEVDDVDSSGSMSTKEDKKYMIPISRNCSVVIMIAYVAYILFQLKTHSSNMADDDGGEEEEEESALGLGGSLALLTLFTIVVAVCSESLTGALENAIKGSPMSKAFVGIVLLPIVGNACEHASAIRFAMQEKMGLSVGIAVGSSVQIGLFVAPLSVVMGWMIGDIKGTNMTLNLGLLNVVVLTMSVILVVGMVVDGKSNWLEGFMLIVAYIIIAILYWFMPDAVTTTTGVATTNSTWL